MCFVFLYIIYSFLFVLYECIINLGLRIYKYITSLGAPIAFSKRVVCGCVFLSCSNSLPRARFTRCLLYIIYYVIVYNMYACCSRVIHLYVYKMCTVINSISSFFHVFFFPFLLSF